MASKSSYYNTGGGGLKFTPIVDGVLGSQEEFGQTENVSFSTEMETLTHDNTETCVTYEDINILKKVTGKLNIETIEISPLMLERAFLGKTTRVTKASGSDITSNVTIVALGMVYTIGVKYLSNLVVKDDGNVETYVEGTDYMVNLNKGLITAIDGGDITAGDILNLTYNNVEYDDINIEGFINSK